MTESKSAVAPIIVKRSGELISAPELTAEQQEDLSMAVFKAFCRLHPEVIREAVENNQAEAGLSGMEART